MVKSRSKRSKNSFGRWIYRAAFLAFVGMIFYIIFFSGKLSVTAISVSGGNEINADIITSRISSRMDGKYLGVIDKNNILLIRSGKAEDDLRREFRKIENIEVKRKFPGTILVNIQERRTPVIFLSGEKGFSVDENGIAYDQFQPEASGASGNALIILRDSSASEINLGEAILSQDYIAYLVGIRDGMKKEADIEIDNNYETPSVVSSDVRVKTTEGWKVYFGTDINLKKELEMLVVSLENKIDKARRPDLDYIDLRSDNKVFYKFKDGSTDVSQDEPQPDSQEPAKEDKKSSKKTKK